MPPLIFTRHLAESDMGEVMNIETSLDHPKTEEEFRAQMAGPIDSSEPPNEEAVVCIVATLYLNVVGFYVIEPLKRCFCVLDFVVAPEHRRQGVGTALMDNLMRRVASDTKERSRIVFEVPERSMDMLAFLKRFDFRATKVLRDYIDVVPPEDAFVMEYRIKDAGEEGMARAA